MKDKSGTSEMRSERMRLYMTDELHKLFSNEEVHNLRGKESEVILRWLEGDWVVSERRKVIKIKSLRLHSFEN